MKLGLLERLYVNSPLRAYLQRPLELALLNRIAPLPTHAHVLEIGCGNGSGLATIAHRFSPASVTGVDIDLAQITRARTRLSHLHIPYNLLPVSATEVPLPAHGYDVILSLGCLGHIATWPAALTECTRLLRPGGLLYVAESYHASHNFTQSHLAAVLTTQGFTMLGTSPKPTNPLKRWLATHASIAVYRLNNTPAAYD